MAQKPNWMEELLVWADEQNIPQEKLSRKKEILFKTRDLDLSDCQLTELHNSVGNLPNLIYLDLTENRLTTLPKSIGNLKNLKSLCLENNKFQELPDFVGQLRNLVELNLYNNQISKFPEFINKLEKLKRLNIALNYLDETPESIRNILSNLNVKFINSFNKFEAMFDDDNYNKSPNLDIVGLNEQLQQHTPKTKMKTYQQKILFGSPGTGKSYQIDKHIIPYELLIDVEKMPANVIKTVFHPEYTYGDFVGKLMPITVGGNVQYKFYEGHFLKALSQAYKNIIAAQENDSEIEKVALVIDEINRGNSAAIFGTIFQLLDRNPDGWSSYEVSVNEIIFNKLLDSIGIEMEKSGTFKYEKLSHDPKELQDKLKFLNCNFESRTIKIPPNLSILASMNTSDSSIYYMDSAFKRRWEWEFIDVDPDNTVSAEGVAFSNRDEWKTFIGKLNTFIKSNHKSIRGIEDKQIGHFFITDDVIQKSSVQNKLMFFLWDSVFNRDKKPLITLLFGDDKENELITFGDFAKLVQLFIDKINERE